jgi:hypothetical protein
VIGVSIGLRAIFAKPSLGNSGMARALHTRVFPTGDFISLGRATILGCSRAPFRPIVAF